MDGVRDTVQKTGIKTISCREETHEQYESTEDRDQDHFFFHKKKKCKKANWLSV